MAQKLSHLKAAVKAYVGELAKVNIKPERIILFGSYARGTATDDSDVDLVVISKDLGRYPFPERLSVLSRATLNIPEPFEVLGYTPDEIEGKRGESILWDEIVTTGEEVYKAA